MVPPLLEAVLGDYQSSNPLARDAEVLGLFATVVNRLQVCVCVCVRVSVFVRAYVCVYIYMCPLAVSVSVYVCA